MGTRKDNHLDQRLRLLQKSVDHGISLESKPGSLYLVCVEIVLKTETFRRADFRSKILVLSSHTIKSALKKHSAVQRAGLLWNVAKDSIGTAGDSEIKCFHFFPLVSLFFHCYYSRVDIIPSQATTYAIGNNYRVLNVVY